MRFSARSRSRSGARTTQVTAAPDLEAPVSLTQEGGEHQPGREPTDVRPAENAGIARQRRDAAEELRDEPQQQQQERRSRLDYPQEYHGGNRAQRGAGEEHQVT